MKRKNIGARPYVVHVSGDFPDPIAPEKTEVIRSLIDLTECDFYHRVVSINRSSPSFRSVFLGAKNVTFCQPFEYGEALQYAAPSKGVLHAAMLHSLGDYLVERFKANPPDLLFAHKLTVEGFAVAHAAKRLRIPYVIAIQGNTDTKILNLRPDLRGKLASIYHGASYTFPFTPWARKTVEKYLGARRAATKLLPCPTDLDEPLAPVPHGDGLISVFHLRNARNKNLAGIAAGYRQLPADLRKCDINIVGGGTEADLRACNSLIGVGAGVKFEGSLSRTDLKIRLNSASGFVLPSIRESYGLVFIEALFAGLPIIYPKGAAIDGFFDDFPFAIAVNARDDRQLADAMAHLLRDESRLKAALREWQRSDHARQFTRPAIAERFREGLHHAIAARSATGHGAL